jgi:hypothetical protein
MLATAMLPQLRSAGDRAGTRKPSFPRVPAGAGTGEPSPQLDDLLRRYRQTLRTLAETRARADRAERRLRSRLTELTWPAALSGIVGGFVAIVGLRLAGL